MTPRGRVAIVGAGIAGLTAAYRLSTAIRDDGRSLEITMLEGSARLGGKLHTIELGGMQVEEGADSFVVRKPWAVDLCGELGLGDELVVPASRGAFVLVDGKLVAFPARSAFGIPASPRELLRWPGLSLAGRLRAAGDLFIPPRDPGDESIGALASRRLGREAADVLVGPLLAGIHAGDPYRLSVSATFPELRTWEAGHGSLIRGARASLKAAQSSKGALQASPWGGMTAIVSSLERAVGRARIRLGASASAVRRTDSGYEVVTTRGNVAADAVVLATPAFVTARLLASLNPEVSRELSGIPYASTAVVCLVYPEGTGSVLPEGTGFIVPRGPAVTTACTWVSRKWPRDEHGDRAVVRCYVGRFGHQAPLALPDREVVGAVRREVEPAMGIRAEPSAVRVARWEEAMPQYEVGHLDRLGRVDQQLRRTRGVFLTGSAYRGVGIADCVRDASEVAGRVGAYLASPRQDGTGLEPHRAAPGREVW